MFSGLIEKGLMMARKRLNKKVALISSLFFVILAIFAIALILYFTQGPEKFIEDGDAAWLAKDYELADKNYSRAKTRAKDDSLIIELWFKLADVFMETGEWPKVRGCWQGVIETDRENLKAQYAWLKFYYIVANSGMRGLWKDVESRATEILEIVENKGLLAEDTAQWELPIYEKTGLSHSVIAGSDGVQRIGLYLYLYKL